jgi:hypothetical protein
MERSNALTGKPLGNSGIDWAKVPDEGSGIDWDKVDADQREQARNLVHSGQESYFPDMATAAGKQLVALARKGANLLNIGGSAGPTNPGDPDTHDPTAFGSIENIKAAEQEAKDAAAKPGGRFGQIVADTAGTAPIGGPIEGLGASVLGKSLLARIAAKTASGAAIGAVGSDPGERVTGAETGGVLGSSLGALQELGGRLLSGLVKKSNSLQNLEGDVARTNALPGATQRNLFVPVSQGADPDDMLSSTIGNLYRGGLPYIPGVSAQLERQANAGRNTMFGTMLQSSAPEGIVVPAQATQNMQLSTQQVRDAYDEIYQNLRKVNNIAIPKDFKQDLTSRINAADPQIPQSDVENHVNLVYNDLQHQAENSADSRINAFNLKNTRDNIPTLANRVGQEVPTEQKAGLFDTTKEYIDSIFSKKLLQSFNLNNQSTQDILTAYKANAPNYENFAPLEAAVKASASKTGVFTPGSVARRANDFTDMQGMDQDYNAVFGKPPVQPSASARVAGYPVAAAASYYLGHLPGVMAMLGAGNALATKTAQRALYGDNALQSALSELATRNPRLAASLGYAARNAVTSDVGEE